MIMIQIFVILVLAAVAVLLARIVVRLHEGRRREERQLDASAHTVSRLISRRVCLNMTQERIRETRHAGSEDCNDQHHLHKW